MNTTHLFHVPLSSVVLHQQHHHHVGLARGVPPILKYHTISSIISDIEKNLDPILTKLNTLRGFLMPLEVHMRFPNTVLGISIVTVNLISSQHQLSNSIVVQI